MFKYWQMQFLTLSLTWSGPGRCYLIVMLHTTAWHNIKLLLYIDWFIDWKKHKLIIVVNPVLFLSLMPFFSLLCQGGSGWSYLSPGRYLPSQLYGLSGQDQRGSGCHRPGCDGATGTITCNQPVILFFNDLNQSVIFFLPVCFICSHKQLICLNLT